MRQSIISWFIFATILTLSAFHPKDEFPNVLIKKDFHQNLGSFNESIEEYLEEAQLVSLDYQTLLEKHVNCRLAYKRIEFLLYVFEEEEVEYTFNGAPLPRVADMMHVEISEPVGLQVLDELVVEDSLDQAKIIRKVLALQSAFDGIIYSQKSRNFSDLALMDAMRKQLIRIITMGITGFDTPGTLNGLAEAQAALKEMRTGFSHYRAFCIPAAKGNFETVIQLFDESIHFLDQHDDFETFNRMYFIRNMINPLYEEIYLFHLAMGKNTLSDRANLQRSTNYKAKNPFSPNFLNPYFYTYLTAEQDNEQIAKLGSLLFYDPVLSADNSMSCFSCHNPKKGFTDGLNKSLSNDGKQTVQRNSPTLINAVFSKNQFYDLRVESLENQVADVVTNPKEFHTEFEDIADKLSQSSDYQDLFDEAFAYASWSPTKIDRYTITTALTAYVKNLRSFNSSFDRYIRQETDEISPKAIIGFNLFMGKAACGTCHFAPLFNGLVPPNFEENETEVLGVPVDKNATKLDPDPGRFARNKRTKQIPHFKHSFKTVTVRNVALTAPYMHNGVYETLEEVMDFYNNGGGAGMGLNIPHQTLAADSLHLSDEEQTAIILFLESLTDTSYQVHRPKILPEFPSNSRLHSLDRRVGY